MIPVSVKCLVIVIMAVGCIFSARSQHIYVNTSEMVYELTYSNGQCQLEKIPILCNLSASRTIYSIAIYRDTLYYNSGKNLFRVVPGKPGSCERVTTLPGLAATYNCMAADKYGRIMTIEFNSKMLYRYDPSTDRLDTLGQLPSAPAGDLMYYKEKLLYATVSDGIFEIDLTSPSSSKQYMATPGYSFFGLLSFPFDCNNNKVYGISLHSGGTSTDLIELDLEKRFILSKFTTLNYGLYDAASSVDNGSTLGISLDSVELVLAHCNSKKGSDAHFLAFTAVQGAVSYTMDGGTANDDGKFTHLAPGQHTLQLKNSKGCMFDTVISIVTVKDPKPDIHFTIEDQHCPPMTGQVSIDITGTESPYDINFNGEGYKSLFNYQRLAAGKYPIIVRNKNECSWDTFVVVKSDCETLFMPNAFTPNSDGNNDLIRPVFSNSMGDVSFIVFNRFGQKVFESVGPTKGWDGRIGGAQQPSGSYAYIIRYQNALGAQVVKKGTFMLIR
jgi:gliding motility-associated-like protein